MPRRIRYEVDRRIKVLVWLACIAAAYIITAPIYHGLRVGDALLFRLLSPQQGEDYLVATRTLEIGHVIESADLEWTSTPGYDVEELLRDPEVLVGQSVRERILAGDALRLERLVESKHPGLSAVVPEGMRAVSIHLSNADRVSGFVEPGDRVDLLVTLFDKGRMVETSTVLEYVQVLSVDDHLAEVPLGQSAIKPQITLLASPEHANRLVHALEVGRPRLVLRSDHPEPPRIPTVGTVPLTSPAREPRDTLEARTLRETQAKFHKRVRRDHLPRDPRARAQVEAALAQAGLFVSGRHIPADIERP